MWKRATPNALTILRLVLAVAFPFLPHELRLTAFLISAVSDGLDGYLARRWDAQSRLGQALDPVADKLFLLSVALTLLFTGLLSPAEFLLAGLRDGAVVLFLVVMAAQGRLGQRGEALEPRLAGKLTTALQFAMLVTFLWSGACPGWLTGATAVAGAVAAVDYFRAYRRLLRAG